MIRINEKYQKIIRPERIIQIGEGVFLRGFFDWMLQKLNDSGTFSGNAVIVQPREGNKCAPFTEQDCLYTHIIRGAEGTESTIINSVSRIMNPYDDFGAFLALADEPDMRFIVSNTTEAGIVYDRSDKMTDCPNVTYPAKLTSLLYRRYTNGMDGFIVLPCELTENNGDTLKKIVLRYADDWKLENGFAEWINKSCVFCNTLVDRIVTGAPKDEKPDLGYEDKLLDASEYFHLWVIEAGDDVRNELPFDKAGLNVKFVDDLSPYHTRKVRILNGAHTSMVCLGLNSGLKTVGDCMNDEKVKEFVRQCIFDEIIPTLDLPESELVSYANDVLTRFKNPYIKHALASISLNSVSKFKVRVLPSIIEYRKRFGRNPACLSASLGELIRFYKYGDPNDDDGIINEMRSLSAEDILKKTEWWGVDLSFLKEEVIPYASER